MKWDYQTTETLLSMWDKYGGKTRRIAREMALTPGQIASASRRLGLHYRGGKKFRKHLAEDSAPSLEARTVYPSRVRPADLNVLKTGDNQRKLGGRVRKGRWKGFPIFALTLEERATCPRSCRQWASCYGNNMQWAVRYQHGADLERALVRELTALQQRYYMGFVVRLHILGDFYSPGYVQFWEDALLAFPALRVFGHTHHQRGHVMGDAIAKVRDKFGDRFSIRHSDAYSGFRTSVIKSDSDAGDRIVCPAQTGRTKNCGTCALCWGSTRPIAFLEH